MRKLHKKIYKAIEGEYGRERVWENAKSELRGKRKGYSPIELLTGKKQEQDWLVTLLKEVKIST